MSRPSARQNFGRNVAFLPEAAFAPRSETELLEILARHRGTRLRAHGSLHAWSPAAATEGVALDLRHFDSVTVSADDEGPVADVGAGCTIDRALGALAAEGDLTLPTVGVIGKQTVAGAAATGTHGSGRHALSHFVLSARIATFRSDGEPVVRTVEGGEALEAVRCGVGTLGVVTSLRLRVRPQYRVEEHFAVHAGVDDLLAAEAEYPLQQSYLVPWDWRYFVQHRREVESPRSRSAELYRAFCYAVFDVGLHCMILALVRGLRSTRLTRVFYRRGASLVIPRGWTVIERSDRQLMMEHDLFRHVEIELFVTRPRLKAAMNFLTEVLRFLGEGHPLSARRRSPCSTRRDRGDRPMHSGAATPTTIRSVSGR